MTKFVIHGGQPLEGQLRVHGAKNAALPILAASVLASGKHGISDVPQLLDIHVMLSILESLGIKTKHKERLVSLDTSTLSTTEIPEELMGKMRSSIFLLGPLLARSGEVTVTRPGGCAIGERPIDLHLDGLRALGAHVKEEHGKIVCQAQKLIGNHIHLRYPSVGATENIMMAATLAEGTTVISNPAREPEIADLQNFLNKMGANVQGASTDRIIIKGVQKLTPMDYQVIPDRIITGTLILAAAITRGHVELCNVRSDHIESLLSILKASGVEITESIDKIAVKATARPRAIDVVQTAPYPGFATDMQAQLMAYLSQAKGTSIIKETVFEGRFKHVDELNRMGANISCDLNTAFIRGVPRLYGATVEASDLRAGAALVIAGLMAEGTTHVECIHHIDRGYEHLEKMLQQLGATINRNV